MTSKRNSHSSYLLQAHIIFVTKYRKKILTNEILNKAEDLLGRECVKLKSEVIEINGEADHIHMIVSYPPSLSVSKLVQVLKSVTGRELLLYYPELQQPAWRKNAIWSSGYFACSVGGAPISILRNYIEQQNRPN